MARTVALKTFALLCPVQVPAYWVAQLQMEMLASGTHSIVLLSRSATKVPRSVSLAKRKFPLALVLNFEHGSSKCAWWRRAF